MSRQADKVEAPGRIGQLEGWGLWLIEKTRTIQVRAGSLSTSSDAAPQSRYAWHGHGQVQLRKVGHGEGWSSAAGPCDALLAVTLGGVEQRDDEERRMERREGAEGGS